MIKNIHLNSISQPCNRWELWRGRHAAEQETVRDNVALNHTGVHSFLPYFLNNDFKILNVLLNIIKH